MSVKSIDLDDIASIEISRELVNEELLKTKKEKKKNIVLMSKVLHLKVIEENYMRISLNWNIISTRNDFTFKYVFKNLSKIINGYDNLLNMCILGNIFKNNKNITIDEIDKCMTYIIDSYLECNTESNNQNLFNNISYIPNLKASFIYRCINLDVNISLSCWNRLSNNTSIEEIARSIYEYNDSNIFLWNWDSISMKAKIEDIGNYPNLPWKFNILHNCDFNKKIVEANIDKPWVFSLLFKNIEYDYDFIDKYYYKNWNWNHIFDCYKIENGIIPLKFINKYISKCPSYVKNNVLKEIKLLKIKLMINKKKEELKIKKQAVDKISYWFLKCKYNPNYKYCKNRLNKEYDSLYNIE